MVELKVWEGFGIFDSSSSPAYGLYVFFVFSAMVNGMFLVDVRCW